MSGTSDDKLDPSKALPLDLAKLASVRTADGKTPLIMAGQHQTIRGMRVLTTAPGQGTTGSTIIMPSQVLKAAGHQITGIINTGQVGGGTTTPLPANITIQRPAQISLPVSNPGGATYHVPRGPAVVANLSAPRNSTVGPSIRAPLNVRDIVPQQQSSNLVQQFSVRPTRTPSPSSAMTAAWLTTVNATSSGAVAGNGKGPNLQQQQLLTPMRSASAAVAVSLGNASMGGATITPAIVTAKGGATVVPAGLVVTRTQPGQQPGPPQAVGTTLATIRPTIFQPTAHIPISSPMHQYKPGSGQVGATNITGNVSIAQVLPHRTQTLVYSGAVNPQQTQQHPFANAPRLAISTPSSSPYRHTSIPRSVVTATRLTMPTGAQTAQAGARVLAAPPGTTVLTSTGVRISAVSTIAHHHQQHQNQPIPASLGGGAIVNRCLSTSVPLASSTSTTTSLGGGATLTPAPPVSIAGPGGRLSVTVAPGSTATLSLTNNAHGQLQQQSQIINTAGGMRSHPLNLHTLPLLGVSNTSPHHGLSGPGGGLPKGGVHPSGAIQQLHATMSSIKAVQNIATTASRTNVNIKTAGIVTQRQANVGTSPAIPIGKVYPQQGDSAGVAQANVYIHTTSVPSAPKRASPAAAASISQPAKLTSSPRPSILRKRDNDGSPLKAAKNLTPTLNTVQQQQHTGQPQHLQMPLEHIRPDSRNNGNSSEGGSTTISASSSPGLGDANEDMSIPMNIIKGEEENRPPPEMSPRKKPRKQNLAGNDFDEHRHDDMQFLNDHRDVKKEMAPHAPPLDHHIPPITDTDHTLNNTQQFQIKLELDTATSQTQQALLNQQQQLQQQRSGGKIVTRKPQASLLNSYRQTWKTTNNHYLRYSDVKPKDERRPSIMDLSNQYRVLDKVNGWKIHHLSTQMEDLADQEQAVYNQLTDLLKYTESREWNSYDKDVNRINELIKGNLQRIKIINDGMVEAKVHIMKIFDHKTHVIDIISRCASKRNYKKREKV